MSNFVINPYIVVSPVVETTYNQLTAAQDTDIGSGEYNGEGANSTDSLLYNVGIVACKFMPYNPSSNSGTVTCSLRNSLGALLHTFWTYDMALLPTSNTNELIAGTTTPFTGKTAVGDSISCTATAACKISNNTSNPFDGTDSCRFYNFSAAASGTNDLGFQITVSS